MQQSHLAVPDFCLAFPFTIFHFLFCSSPTSSSAQAKPKRTSSQPIQIPEIPPFKKRDNQHSNYPPHHGSSQSPQASSSSMNTANTMAGISPPKAIADIPPYKPRKSKDLTPTGESHQQVASSSSSSSQHRESQDSTASHQVPEHQITIGPTGGAEWMKRLKVAEQSPIHRSTDCIVSKDMGTSSDSELLKPAPSWSNVAMKTEQTASTSEIIESKFSLGISFILYALIRRKCTIRSESNDDRGGAAACS